MGKAAPCGGGTTLTGEMTITALLFDADGQDAQLDWTGTLPPLKPHQLLWLDLEAEPAESEQAVLAVLPLDPTDQAALHRHTPGPRLLYRTDHTQLSVNTPPEQSAQAPVRILAAKNLVVTLHAEPAPFLKALHQQLRGDTQLGQLDAAAFLAVLLNYHLESYYALLSPLEDSIDRLDEHILRDPARNHLADLVRLRQRVSVLRRALGAHRMVYAGLASPEFTVFQGDQPETLLTRLFQQYQHAYEAISHTREMVLGSFDLYMTSTGQHTNEIMRVLTVVTVLLGLLGVLAGILGTNFQAGIFKSGEHGFRLMLGGMFLLLVSILSLARWRRWL